MSTTIKNITELRNDLLEKYQKLNSKEITVKEAKEITAMSSRIMSSCKLEIGYAKHQNKTAVIPFLEPSNQQ